MSESSTSGVQPSGEEGLRQRASRGTLFSLSGQVGQQFLRLASNLILARLLFPEAFGIMAIIYMVVFALEQFSNIGIPSAVMRYEHGDQSRFLDTAWTIQVLRGFLLWFIGLAVTPTVAAFYDMPQLRELLPVATFAAVLLGFQSTHFHVLTRRLMLGRRVAIEVIARVVSILLMVTMAWIQPSIWALVYGGLANYLVLVILSHVWIPGPRVRLSWDRAVVAEVFSLGKWVFASSGLSFALAQIDVALLGKLVDGETLGIYSQSAQVPMVLRDVGFIILSSVVAPIVAESNREGSAVLRARYASIRRLILPAALLLGLGAMVAAPAFFEFLYDERYRDASWMAQLGLVRSWFAFMQVAGCISLLSLGDGRSWVISNIVGLVGVSGGCLVGFELGGMHGLLIGMGAGSALGVVAPAVQLWRIGVANPGSEIRYTLLGATLVAWTWIVVEVSADWVPLGDSMRMLIVGSIALAPYALWTGLRIIREFRFR